MFLGLSRSMELIWMHQQSPTLLCSHVLRSLHLFEITGSGLQCEIVCHRSGFTMQKDKKLRDVQDKWKRCPCWPYVC
jgi:hypothetical protein